MKVGIPREVKNQRVSRRHHPRRRQRIRSPRPRSSSSRRPASARRFRTTIHSGWCEHPPTADEVWDTGELILKVKEPIAEEYGRMRKGQTLFTYLHLAASRPCTDALIDSGTTAIAYETVQLPDRSLPLLAPMSEVAGRMAPQVGAYHLQREGGGRGVLMGGVSGVYAAKVVVLGAGVSGMNAAAIAGCLRSSSARHLQDARRRLDLRAMPDRRPTRTRWSEPASTPTW